MNEELEFMVDEAESIEKTIVLLEQLMDKTGLNEYEVIAFGTLLQNVYLGIENIIRCQLEMRGSKFHKGESWHKDLLRAALENDLVKETEYPIFLELLSYRHRHIHGYGHMLDEPRLRELAAPVPAAVRAFLNRVKSK